jgi:hypothetical protein
VECSGRGVQYNNAKFTISLKEIKPMIFNTKVTQKNVCQKLTNISLVKNNSKELWSELDETSLAAVNGGGASASYFVGSISSK